MSTYAYSVKVRKTAPYVWRWDCPACGRWEASSSVRKARRRGYRWATIHAAVCSDLHWANLAAACPSCRRYGRVAPACPVCLGRGHIVEREALT